MGIWEKGVGYLKDKTSKVTDKEKYQQELLKTFSFTSVGGGTGNSTILLYVAQYLSLVEKKQVLLIDLNFLQPDLLYNLNLEVTSENSILNYIKGTKKLEDCFIQDTKNPQLHLITASPKDDVVLLMSMRDDRNIIGEMIEKVEMFDYILINLPYVQPFITFIEPINVIDRGFLIVDERLSCLKKIQTMLDFIHSFTAKSHLFNNVVINKRTKYEYPYETLNELHCNVISEVPYDTELMKYVNEKDPYIDKIKNKEIQLKIGEIIENLKS